MTMLNQAARLGYLSAGARVSTRTDAELVGPRSHVLGVINGYESLGWEVEPYIVGDRVPPSWVRPGSERVARGPWLQTLGIDLLRMSMGTYHAIKSGWELRGQVDWVYERGALLQAMGWVFQRRGVPWILETNSLQWKEAAEDRESLVLQRVARRIEFASYRACDVLVPVSEALRDVLVERGIDPRKMVVVPNGVDISTFDPSQYETDRAAEGFVVGFVGALSEWQALPLLFRAVRALRDEGLDIRVRIVGDGHARQEWEAEARRLQLEGQVEFVGYQPHHEVPHYILGFDVGYSGPARLATGNMYMSPLKLYEYLAMETPLVAAAYEDAQRLVEDEKVGYLFEPESVDDLKRALREAYADRGAPLRRRGRRGRDLIETSHSWKARIRRLNGEVRRILSASNTPEPSPSRARAERGD
jgi:glycosyltransferase involved in cell wall biosynthesis